MRVGVVRVALVIALALLGACVAEKLALSPQSGVDLSGHWRLNALESDDPQHLIESQTVDPSKSANGAPGQRGQGGRGGRGGRGGSYGGIGAPSMPALSALGEALRWPGKEVQIKQVAGVVAFTSGGVNVVYEPGTGEAAAHAKARGRDGQPARCGWEEKTLVVQGGAEDEDNPPFEQRYSLSADGQRLIEVVGFKNGVSAGFTLSRVWDRAEPTQPMGIHPSGR